MGLMVLDHGLYYKSLFSRGYVNHWTLANPKTLTILAYCYKIH